MRWPALLVAGLMLTPTAVADPVVSERPDKVALTVYHSGADFERSDPREFSNPDAENGLAFITETRTIDVPAGPAVIELRGVASTIVPQTASVEGLPFAVLERNFDYDLLSPGSLLAKSVGTTVTLVRTNPKTGKRSEEKAVVRSGPQGTVLDFGGRVEALSCSGLPEKLVFDRLPEGLRDTPTLSIRTNAARAGRYTVKVHYIAAGMNWAANYVARIRPDGTSFDLTGWVTLINGSDTGFTHVPLDIVAGHLETDDDSKPVEAAKVFVQTGCWPMDVSWVKRVQLIDAISAEDIGKFPDQNVGEALQRSESMETVTVTGFRAAIELGDYKLYSLAQPTDVLARQSKQIQFVDQDNVPFERLYFFNLNDVGGWQRADAAIRFQNKKESHLGVPLPAGFFTLTTEDPPVLLGRANFGDTSSGLPVNLTLGPAQDVFVLQREVSREKTGNWFARSGERTTLEVTIQNNKTAPIAFALYQQMEDGLTVESEPMRHTSQRYGMTWEFPLAAGETKTLRFVFERLELN